MPAAAPAIAPPGAEGDTAIAAGVGGVQQRQRGREDGRAADALYRPRDHQQLGGARESTGERGDGEDHQARQIGPLGAEPVGEGAEYQQQCREGQGVSVDDPLQSGQTGAQAVGDVGQCDIDDGDVDEQHERAEARREQGEPFPHGDLRGV